MKMANRRCACCKILLFSLRCKTAPCSKTSNISFGLYLKISSVSRTDALFLLAVYYNFSPLSSLEFSIWKHKIKDL